MNRLAYGLGAITVLFAFTSCEIFGPTNCTTSVEPGVVVEVYRADTGEPTAAGARGWLEDGPYVDSLRAYQSDADGDLYSLSGAYERPGTYAVHLEKDGFESWQRLGVKVEDAECHVHMVRLRAELVPAP